MLDPDSYQMNTVRIRKTGPKLVIQNRKPSNSNINIETLAGGVYERRRGPVVGWRGGGGRRDTTIYSCPIPKKGAVVKA
jgi:hypothetical protein